MKWSNGATSGRIGVLAGRVQAVMDCLWSNNDLTSGLAGGQIGQMACFVVRVQVAMDWLVVDRIDAF